MIKRKWKLSMMEVMKLLGNKCISLVPLSSNVTLIEWPHSEVPIADIDSSRDRKKCENLLPVIGPFVTMISSSLGNKRYKIRVQTIISFTTLSYTCFMVIS